MPTSIQDHIIYTQNELNDLPYYKEVFSILEKENIKSFLDIGANCGEFGKFILNKIPSIKKAFFIEPEIENFNFLKNNIGENSNYIFLNIAIGYSNLKKVKLIESSNTGGHQIDTNSIGDIDLFTLEDINIPIVDFLKMDIEGMEFEIIKKSTYLKQVKWLEIEFHQTPEESKNKYVKDFIHENLQEYDLINYQKDDANFYGRCLLKKK